MSLLQLQRELQAHVLHDDPDIESRINHNAIVSTTTRLGVYSDAYRLRLVEALESNYPVTAELLGADQFALLASAYLKAHPSQHFSIRWFGHRLPEFVADTQADKPWLADLARWEWATAHAFDATDATVLTQTDVAALAPEQWSDLALRTHPSLTVLRLKSNIVEIVKASANHAPLPTPSSAALTEWCVWRQNLNVHYRSLDTAESHVIDQLQHGVTFGALCEHLAEHFPNDNIPLRAASLLKQWLQEQWLSSVD